MKTARIWKSGEFDAKRRGKSALVVALSECPPGNGPGSCLCRRFKSFGFEDSEKCGCVQLATEMNAWGPAECRRRLDSDILPKIKANVELRGLPYVETVVWPIVEAAIGEAEGHAPTLGQSLAIGAARVGSALLPRRRKNPVDVRGTGSRLADELRAKGVVLSAYLAAEMDRRGPKWALDQVYTISATIAAESAGRLSADESETLLRAAVAAAPPHTGPVSFQHQPLHKQPKPAAVPVAGPPVRAYLRPTRSDLAVCLAVFSPAGFRSPTLHYRRVRDLFRSAGIPLFVIALAYDEGSPPIADADFVVRSASVLFHKENLFNLIEKRLPAGFTKLATIDADVVFSDPDWYDRLSELLDRMDVVQPMHGCRWLDQDGKEIGGKPVAAKAVAAGLPFSHHYHPGFAWAFRREAFRSIGGFFEESLVGGGDMVFTCALENLAPELVRDHSGNIGRDSAAYEAYRARVAAAGLRVGYLDGCDAWHLWHGSRDKRGYTTRAQWMPRSPLVRNADGVIETTSNAERKAMLGYFRARDEDEGLAPAADESAIAAAVQRAKAIHGWSAPETLDWLARHAAGKGLVIEFGTFAGRSLAALMTARKVVACDWWDWHPDAAGNVRTRFAAEISASRLEVIEINLLKDADRLVSRFAGQAELVYIDANHTREAVLHDIATARQLVRPGGIICGHDFDIRAWPGVGEAVREAFPRQWQTIHGSHDGLWWVCVGNDARETAT